MSQYFQCFTFVQPYLSFYKRHQMSEFDCFGEMTPEEKAAKEAADKNKSEKKKEEKVGKSTCVINVKPVDVDVDLDKLVEKIKSEIKVDGLLWGIAQQKEMHFGLKMIQIGAVVTDDVDLEGVTETIEEWEEVSSTEIAAFQKI